MNYPAVALVCGGGICVAIFAISFFSLAIVAGKKYVITTDNKMIMLFAVAFAAISVCIFSGLNMLIR